MKIVFFFIDGIGLGEANPNINPFAAFSASFFNKNFGYPLTREIGRFLSEKICMIPLDASLGVEGLPQSATGQTALFTGINAPRKVGHHVQAFPGPQLTKIIAEYGIIKQVMDAGLKATFANMYSPDYLELVRQRKRRHSVSTLLSLSSGSQLRSIAEMMQGEAVYQDITNEMLPVFGVSNIDPITPMLAAQRLLQISRKHELTLFEYFQTDRIGHKLQWDKAEKIVCTLDAFLTSLQENLPSETMVIVASDHGNFEDFSIRTHTMNQIPLIVFGHRCKEFCETISELTDITPRILSVLKGLK